MHRVHVRQLCRPQSPWGINQGVRYGDREPSQVTDPHTTAAKRGNLLLSVPTRNTPSPYRGPSLCSLRIGQGILQHLRFKNFFPLTTEKMPLHTACYDSRQSRNPPPLSRTSGELNSISCYHPIPTCGASSRNRCSSRTVSGTGLHRARKFQATQCGAAANLFLLSSFGQRESKPRPQALHSPDSVARHGDHAARQYQQGPRAEAQGLLHPSLEGKQLQRSQTWATFGHTPALARGLLSRRTDR